jgi:hypothetical protein
LALTSVKGCSRRGTQAIVMRGHVPVHFCELTSQKGRATK